jgi:long-chain acyl-CoA synthetase
MTVRTVDEALRRVARRTPDAVALVTDTRATRYADLATGAAAVATGLERLGLRRGDRVVVALPNGLEAVLALYGVLAAGGIVVPASPGLKADKLRFVLEHSDASVLLGTPAIAGAAGGLVPTVIAGGEGPAPAMSFAELTADVESPRLRHIDLDVAAIVYTSGSTGRPKGVTLTHGSLVFVMDSICEYLEMSGEDRILSVLPLAFGYGLSQLLTCVNVGARLVLEDGLGLPGRMLARLAELRITGMAGVPTIFRLLTSHPAADGTLFPDLRFLTNAGAGLPTTTGAAIRKRFPGARLYAMYGQTECIRVCYLPPEEFDEYPGSVGVPIPGTEVWIEDEDGVEVADGEIGELVVRGSHVMQGYWKDPAGTSLKLREGKSRWERVLRTGDLFRRDDAGRLWFVSRTDDIIKSRGEKVAPREIEDVLHRVDAVAEVAVVGVPDDLLGEAVEAHVAPHDGCRLDPRALRRHCAEQLEDHLVPKRVIVHPALPKTPNGKIDRRALVDS